MENKKWFDSKEEAEAFLDERRNEAKARIEERGDVILGDSSFTYQDFIWKYEDGVFKQTDERKWFTRLGLSTRQMMEDLKHLGIDANAELEKILSEELKKTRNMRDIRETLVSPLNLEDDEIKRKYLSWGKGDCSAVGLCRILLEQLIMEDKKSKGITNADILNEICSDVNLSIQAREKGNPEIPVRDRIYELRAGGYNLSLEEIDYLNYLESEVIRNRIL